MPTQNPVFGADINPVALLILLGVVGAVLVRQVRGHGPHIWIIFGVGAVLALATEAISLPQAAQSLLQAAPVILFLLALFLFAGGLQESGALDYLARWLLGRARAPEGLPAVLFIGFGIASAFIVNDALVLLAIPILFSVSSRLKVDPKPLLLSVAFAVTVGSALTPLGNPQNLLVSISSGISAPMTTYLRYLLLPIVASLVLGGWYLSRVFGPSMRSADQGYALLRSEAPPLFPPGSWGSRLRRYPVLALFPAMILSLFVLELATTLVNLPAIPVWVPALAGAGILLVVSPGRGSVVRYVNAPILLLFVGLFLVVGAAEAGGVITALEAVMPISGPGNLPQGILGIVGTSLVGPQIVSNVPWVALQIPVLSGLGYGAGQPTAWLALGAGSTLAGNVTLLGAASNLILVERAEQMGVHIRLGEFMRYAVPIAAVSIALTLVCLLVGV